MSALSMARPRPSRYLGWRPAALAVVMAALLWLAWSYLDVARLLLAWTPSLLGGAALNLLMGLVAMALAGVIGAALGLLQLGHGPGARLAALLTRSLRALPWLVVMFYVAYLLPFEVRLGGRWVQLPDWLKAAVGLALPASGYVSEFVRGALLAIPASQWEAAAALALGRFQRLRWVILPQALRALLPPAMNLFCTLLMSTSLANLLGVEELMTRLQMHLNSETRPDLLLPAYLYAFLVFFLCVYPLSRWSRRLEQRWSPPR